MPFWYMIKRWNRYFFGKAFLLRNHEKEKQNTGTLTRKKQWYKILGGQKEAFFVFRTSKTKKQAGLNGWEKETAAGKEIKILTAEVFKNMNLQSTPGGDVLPGAAKMKCGRKSGYKMPSWNKVLLASRRDAISLEAVNLVLSKVGEVLTEEAEYQEAQFIFTAPGGKKKALLLVGSNPRNNPNQRNFLFKDTEFNVRMNFVTQEIYDGVISGAFAPVNPSVREKLFGVLLDSPEVQSHIRARALETKKRTKTEMEKRNTKRKENLKKVLLSEEDDDDCSFSLKQTDSVDRDFLTEFEKKAREKSVSDIKKKTKGEE